MTEELPDVRSFTWRGKTYTFDTRKEYTIEDMRILLEKIFLQAVNDFKFYYSKEKRNTECEKQTYKTAKGFLFDDDYYIDFGPIQLQARDIIEEIRNTDVDDKRMEKIRKRIKYQAKKYWRERRKQEYEKELKDRKSSRHSP